MNSLADLELGMANPKGKRLLPYITSLLKYVSRYAFRIFISKSLSILPP